MIKGSYSDYCRRFLKQSEWLRMFATPLFSVPNLNLNDAKKGGQRIWLNLVATGFWNGLKIAKLMSGKFSETVVDGLTLQVQAKDITEGIWMRRKVPWQNVIWQDRDEDKLF